MKHSCQAFLTLFVTVFLCHTAPALRYVQVDAPFHYGEIQLLASSVANTDILTSATDGRVTLWDGERGIEKWTITTHARPIAAHLASDGSVFLGYRSGELDHVSAATGRRIERIRAHDTDIVLVSELGNGELVTISTDGGLRHWRAHDSLVSLGTYRLGSRVTAAAVGTNDSRVYLVAGGSKTSLKIHSWRPGDKAIGPCLVGPNGPTGPHRGMAVSGEGAFIATVSGKHLSLIDTRQGIITSQWRLPQASGDGFTGTEAASVFFYSDSAQIGVFDGGIFTLIHMETGEETKRVSWPDVTVVSRGSEDGKLLLGTAAGGVYGWSIGRERTIKVRESPLVDSLDFRPDSIELVTAGRNELVIWRTAHLRPWRDIRVGGVGSHIIAFNSSGGRLGHARGSRLMIRDGQSLETVLETEDLHRTITSMAWSPNGRLGVGMQDGHIVVVPRLSEPAVHFQGNISVVHDLAWHGDGDRLYAVSEDGWLATFSISQGGEVRRVRPPGQAVPILGVSVNPTNGRVATTQSFLSMYDAVQLWGSDGIHLQTIPTPELSPRDVTFGPRGELLITGNMSASVDVRAASDGALLHRLPAPGGYVAEVAISHDRRYIGAALTGHNRMLRLWRRVR
jgi:WD40 repeat protein